RDARRSCPRPSSPSPPIRRPLCDLVSPSTAARRRPPDNAACASPAIGWLRPVGSCRWLLARPRHEVAARHAATPSSGRGAVLPQESSTGSCAQLYAVRSAAVVSGRTRVVLRWVRRTTIAVGLFFVAG